MTDHCFLVLDSREKKSKRSKADSGATPKKQSKSEAKAAKSVALALAAALRVYRAIVRVSTECAVLLAPAAVAVPPSYMQLPVPAHIIARGAVLPQPVCSRPLPEIVSELELLTRYHPALRVAVTACVLQRLSYIAALVPREFRSQGLVDEIGAYLFVYGEGFGDAAWSECVWDGAVLSVDDGMLPVALWVLCCRHLPAVAAELADSELSAFLTRLVTAEAPLERTDGVVISTHGPMSGQGASFFALGDVGLYASPRSCRLLNGVVAARLEECDGPSLAALTQMISFVPFGVLSSTTASAACTSLLTAVAKREPAPQYIAGLARLAQYYPADFYAAASAERSSKKKSRSGLAIAAVAGLLSHTDGAVQEAATVCLAVFAGYVVVQ